MCIVITVKQITQRQQTMACLILHKALAEEKNRQNFKKAQVGDFIQSSVPTIPVYSKIVFADGEKIIISDSYQYAVPKTRIWRHPDFY